MKQHDLISAAQAGDPDAVARLLGDESPDQKGKGGETALMAAAARGAIEVMEVLVAHGAAVNATTDVGNTALMLAAARGHVEAIRLLLAHGARADHRNKYGLGASDWAKWSEHAADIAVLLEAGA